MVIESGINSESVSNSRKSEMMYTEVEKCDFLGHSLSAYVSQVGFIVSINCTILCLLIKHSGKLVCCGFRLPQAWRQPTASPASNVSPTGDVCHSLFPLHNLADGQNLMILMIC